MAKDTTLKALAIWEDYQRDLTSGHLDFQVRAKKSEDFYFGAGRQWEEAGRKYLEDLGRPVQEENIVFGIINTVLGYQTQSRMDITYKPREASSSNISDVLSEVAMYVLDENQYPWLESQLFGDGIIQGRGFIEIFIDTKENINGDIRFKIHDPMDVIPDRNAKSYDPADWNEVKVLEWMSFDDIKTVYGPKVYRDLWFKAKEYGGESDFGDSDGTISRNKFGNVFGGNAYLISDQDDPVYVRLIRRQRKVLTKRKYIVDIATGDLTPLADNVDRATLRQLKKNPEIEIVELIVKRVRWTVSCKDMILHDEWSPYDDINIIPYFPFFRRGVTVSMVENIISTQEMINKIFSQITHVVNTTANSGWMVQEDSLANMDVNDLEDVGADTGLVLEYRKGYDRPEKISPNPIPQGLTELLNIAMGLMSKISGVSETFQGGKGPEVSGFAIQSRVHQTAIQLAGCVDNLFRTRNMIGKFLLSLIQQFWTAKRTILVTKPDVETGKSSTMPVVLNDVDSEGSVVNDVTVGKYDVVITDVPTQITFQNAQFQQAIEMRKFGISIPDDEMIMLSTLARKNDIVAKINNQGAAQQQLQQYEQSLQQLQDQIRGLNDKLNDKNFNNLLSLAKTAQILATTPGAESLIPALITTAEATDNEEEPAIEQQQQQA